MQFFRSLFFDVKYLIKEILIKIKHPKRKCDIGYHVKCITRSLFTHPLYCLKRGVRNLVIWFPTIWRNDVYDQCYLQNVIDKQLGEMETFWKSGKTHVCGANHIAKRIEWTRKLLQMHRDEYYVMKHYDEFTQRFPKQANFIENSEPCKWDEFGIPTLYRCKPNDTEESLNFYRSGSDKAYKMDEKLYKLFIKNLSKMNTWWD